MDTFFIARVVGSGSVAGKGSLGGSVEKCREVLLAWPFE